ncbi:MAG: PQQ-binding-like beta-propeller repeat protein [Steroidobacteraceae bacterium]|nr:PQQ-binding-like beta-propeller repeat protein [Nevskiaceae bacterium]MCP5359277.1 PQQ-binding-like beta-propeller repeat protein [Nevskiaceae bacterium]MCP5466506.1 PQQ-binding-like beta-propeller repeat protein [Nevskiaceae bacterium]MCP5471787.1 PQQ-binding-like beta-propeller repeat protein [Nevskiaceae bacterium]
MTADRQGVQTLTALAWAVLLAASAGVQAQLPAQNRGAAGAGIYQEHCAACHDGRVTRAPQRWFLEMMSADALRTALETGVMRQQGAALSPAQRDALVAYLAPANAAATASTALPPTCSAATTRFDFDAPPFASGWGIDPENTRFIPAAAAGLEARDVPRLRLQWAFAYPGATRARSQPSFAGGAVLVGSQDGSVFALDAASGCLRWRYRAQAEVRTGITITPWRVGQAPRVIPAYFADLVGRIYAIDAVTGRELWIGRASEHPSATVTAQPVLHRGRVYAAVSSREVVAAADPLYPCCSFRGSIVAFDAANGRLLWTRYTIPETPAVVGHNSRGIEMLAPSGAAVWNSPTVDARRGLLYFGTGQNYSSPAQGSSDAILAIEMRRGGAIRWIRQTTPRDAWNAACVMFVRDKTNCPAENGRDLDYGSPPILLRRLDTTGPGLAGAGRDRLVAGQKSGVVYGLDAADGRVLWERRIGRGGNQGGQHFGMAAEGHRVFVPITDNEDWASDVPPAPGLHAVDARDGRLLWSVIADNVCEGRKYCDPGISAAVTAIPGVVFAGHLDGRFRAYESASGRVLWEEQTDREYPATNGGVAHGGSISGAGGPVIVGGRVYINSGYGYSWHMPGNALLVFAAEK